MSLSSLIARVSLAHCRVHPSFVCCSVSYVVVITICILALQSEDNRGTCFWYKYFLSSTSLSMARTHAQSLARSLMYVKMRHPSVRSTMFDEEKPPQPHRFIFLFVPHCGRLFVHSDKPVLPRVSVHWRSRPRPHSHLLPPLAATTRTF